MDQKLNSVFDDSIRQPWVYFCYRFDALIVNSLTLSIPYDNCHSVFIDDFKVYSVSVFIDNLWIRRKIAFLTIPFVSHESIFAIDLMRRSWIHWRCRLDTSTVTHYLLTIHSVFADDLWISNDIAFLTIPCIDHDSIFSIDMTRR